jgi:MFS family permease
VVNAPTNAGTRIGLVLPTLAAAQFVMLLDSSVMNVAIATVAKDVGTTVTGIQTAITMYTLVMAMFMVTGGKLGSMFGRKRIFMIGWHCLRAGFPDDGSRPQSSDIHPRLVVP